MFTSTWGQWGKTGFLRFEGFEKPQFLQKINILKEVLPVLKLSVNCVSTLHKNYFYILSF